MGETMNLLVIAPCLLSPSYVYRGPKEKEYETARKLRELIGKLGEEWQVLAYPCPEFELIGWPRAPASREVYERLGMRERAKAIADFIGRVLTEENPEKVVFVGVKGSPTCGVFHTSSSDPESYPYRAMQDFFYLSKEERIKRSKELVSEQNFELKPLPGILFEILMARFPEGVYFEFDKDDVEGSINRLEELVR
jgi:predicted secreted protein